MTEAYGLSIPDQLSEVCTPARCAVIIYDMQKGVVPQISAGPEIVVLCRKLLEAARAGGYRIFIHTSFFLAEYCRWRWPITSRHGMATKEEA